MLYVNGKLVNFKNKTQDYEFSHIVSEYHQKIKELKDKYGDIVTFMTNSKPGLDKHTGLRKPHKPYSWPYKAKVVTDDGVEDWVYSSSAATVKDGVATPSDANYIIARGTKAESLSESPDKIFFLLHTSAFNKKKLFIFDSDEQEDKRAKQMMEEVKMKDLLYSEGSPLFSNRDKLIMIASKWGVSNAENVSDNAIRNRLFDLVTNGEAAKKRGGASARGISEFIKDCGGTEDVKIGAEVQNGIDKDILIYDKANGAWKFVVDTDKPPVHLMDVGIVSLLVAKERLIDYLKKDSEAYNTFLKALKGELKVSYGQVLEKEEGEVITPKSEIDPDKLFDKNASNKYVITYREVQSTLKQLGVKAFGKSDEEMREMLRDKLLEMSQTT